MVGEDDVKIPSTIKHWSFATQRDTRAEILGLIATMYGPDKRSIIFTQVEMRARSNRPRSKITEKPRPGFRFVLSYTLPYTIVESSIMELHTLFHTFGIVVHRLLRHCLRYPCSDEDGSSLSSALRRSSVFRLEGLHDPRRRVHGGVSFSIGPREEKSVRCGGTGLSCW